MKKIVLMIAAVLTFTVAQAQEEKAEKKELRPEMRQGFERGQQPDRVAMMKERYNLTEEQVEKVKKLNEEYKDLMFRGPRMGRGQGGPRPNFNARRVEPKADGNADANPQMPQRPSREEMEKRMQERQQKQAEYDSKLKEILDADQFEKYESDQKMMRERIPGSQRGGNRIEPMEKKQ